MIRCIIIEDQPPAQRVLQNFIEDIGTIELLATYSNPIPAMDFLISEEVDLIFLDVHLPIISGIEFLKVIDPRCKVILTTAFTEYAIESYEYQVVDYLLKPFSFERFVMAVSRAGYKSNGPLDLERGLGKDVIFIKSGPEYLKVNIDDILFIKSDSDYTEINTAEKRYLTSQPLRFWLEKLKKHKFFQIHRSYVINTAKIVRISGNRIFLEKELTVPIGRAYKEDFVNQILH